VLKPGINKRTNEKSKPFAAQHGKLFFIKDGPRDFRNDYRSQVRSHTWPGAPWLVNQVDSQYTISGSFADHVFRRLKRKDGLKLCRSQTGATKRHK
jgi:hypothetical protein